MYTAVYINLSCWTFFHVVTYAGWFFCLFNWATSFHARNIAENFPFLTLFAWARVLMRILCCRLFSMLPKSAVTVQDCRRFLLLQKWLSPNCRLVYERFLPVYGFFCMATGINQPAYIYARPAAVVGVQGDNMNRRMRGLNPTAPNRRPRRSFGGHIDLQEFLTAAADGRQPDRGLFGGGDG